MLNITGQLLLALCTVCALLSTAYTDTTPSGQECFSCMGDVCKETVMKCLGVEDRCSKVVIEAEGKKFVTKGCVSKNACSSKSIPGVSIPGVSIPGVSIPGVSIPGVSIPGVSIPGVSIPGVSIPSLSVVTYCCEGKLCNGARQVGQNILLLLFPLLIVKLLF